MKTKQYARIYGRFSSKPQERGDSKRRQIDGAIAYAKQHNLELVEGNDGNPLVYFDEGVSGKAGLNLEKEFGRLLKEAKAGEIILCEESSRLGRQNPFILSNLIYQTTQRGISITMWQEGKIVTPENIEEMGTQFSVFTSAAVGHQENRRKIKRQCDTWAEKRRNGANEPLTATCPSWIKPIITLDERGKKVTKGFELIPTHAAIVKRIFELSLNGMGNQGIARMFNKNGVQGIGGVPTWHPSVIDRILRNRAVLGEFQPMKKNADGKREPEGKPIPNYYPKITGIDETLFNAVQYKRKQRLKVGSGKAYKGTIANLFSGVCKCGFCDAAMIYTHKRSNTLVCDSAKRGIDCRYVGYPYQEFETSFLNYVSELDLESILNPDANGDSKTAVDIQKCRDRISDLEGQLANLAKGIAMGKGIKSLVALSEDLQAETDKQRRTLNELIAEQAASRVEIIKGKELQALIAKAQDLNRNDAVETRSALREAIRNLVTTIEVFPYEIIPVDPKGMTWSERREATSVGYTLTEDVQRRERCYRINFKNTANFRMIFSHPKYKVNRNLKYIVEKTA